MHDPSAPSWRIEKLGPHHDRSEFACGDEQLDIFLRQYAGQNEKLDISQTYVVVQPGDPRVAGYYSIASGSLTAEFIPEALRKRLPRYPVPVVHLGRLAVD